MARTELTIAVRMRWWVVPMMKAAGVFVFVMQPFMDEDDFAGLVGALSGFVVAHGIEMRCEGDV